MTTSDGPCGPDEALSLLMAQLSPVAAEAVPLDQAPGRVLASPVALDRPSPPTDVSAMDGFALRLSDSAGPTPIAGDIRIGQPPASLPRDQALRIVTGGAIPEGAELVIPHEWVLERDGAITLREQAPEGQRATPGPRPGLAPGLNIRRQGENGHAGQVVVAPGVEVSASIAGLLATIGCIAPLVHRRVRVGVLTTGDELIDPHDPAHPFPPPPPPPWRIRDSNRSTLLALLSGKPWLHATALPRAPDEAAPLARAIAAGLDDCDALFVTGGVSMGERDFVPGALAEVGSKILFHRLPQRPGRPILGAIVPGPRAKVVLALPGNPVSVMVTARRFGGAVLACLAGLRSPGLPERVEVIHPDGAAIKLWWFRLARRVGPGLVDLLSGKGSGDVVSAAGADGFVEYPPGETDLPAAPARLRPFYPWSL